MHPVKSLLIFLILFYAWNAGAIDFQSCQNCPPSEMRNMATHLLSANGDIIIYNITNHTAVKYHSFTTREQGLKENIFSPTALQQKNRVFWTLCMFCMIKEVQHIELMK